MTGQAPLGVDLQPPGSIRLERAVWGVDPSTKRISVASVQNGLEWVETLSLERTRDPLRRWREWHRQLVPFFQGLAFARYIDAGGWPAAVFVEEPFAPTDRRQQPTSYYLMGVLWAALGEAFYLESVRFEEIGPGTWKRQAMGEGRGAAKPHEYMAWARDVAGYAGSIEDEAAAIGVATAGGVIVSGG